MAGFQKGMQKPPLSGRRKGVRNMLKLKGIEEFLVEKNIHPVAHLLNLIQQKRLTAKEEAEVWMFIITYCYPKPKDPIDVNLNANQITYTNISKNDVIEAIVKDPFINEKNIGEAKTIRPNDSESPQELDASFMANTSGSETF